MVDRNEPSRRSPFNIIIAICIPAVAISLTARAQAQAISALEPPSATKPAEVRIVATEFSFSPARVLVESGRAVTLVLDNSEAETEHGLFLPAFGFRLQVKAGEIARKNTVFETPGKYDFICDLPGHHDAGMEGTLIVGHR